MNENFTNWHRGEPIEFGPSEMLSWTADELSQGEIYKFIIGSVLPRPIALVSTVNTQGIQNLAPFSFFNGVSSKPPCLSLSFGRKKNGEKKDTLKNIEETGEFVVNSVSSRIAQAMVETAAEYPAGVDEIATVGFTPLASHKIKPPRIKQAMVQFECVLHRLVPIGDEAESESTLVIGRIVELHVAKNIYRDGRIDVEALQPLGRLGGADYAALGERRSFPVPKV